MGTCRRVTHFQGRYSDAQVALENVLGDVYYETPERALTNLGWALYKQGRLAEAERRYRDAIEMRPSFPLAHKNLGVVLQEQGRHREALLAFREAERLLPEDAQVQLYKGISLLKLGEREQAKVAFDSAWRLAPGSETGQSAKNYLNFLE